MTWASSCPSAGHSVPEWALPSLRHEIRHWNFLLFHFLNRFLVIFALPALDESTFETLGAVPTTIAFRVQKFGYAVWRSSTGGTGGLYSCVVGLFTDGAYLTWFCPSQSIICPGGVAGMDAWPRLFEGGLTVAQPVSLPSNKFARGHRHCRGSRCGERRRLDRCHIEHDFECLGFPTPGRTCKTFLLGLDTAAIAAVSSSWCPLLLQRHVHTTVPSPATIVTAGPMQVSIRLEVDDNSHLALYSCAQVLHTCFCIHWRLRAHHCRSVT